MTQDWLDISDFLYIGISSELNLTKTAIYSTLRSEDINRKISLFNELSASKGFKRSVDRLRKAVKIYERRCIISTKFLREELDEVVYLYEQLQAQVKGVSLNG